MLTDHCWAAYAKEQNSDFTSRHLGESIPGASGDKGKAEGGQIGHFRQCLGQNSVNDTRGQLSRLMVFCDNLSLLLA